MTFDIISIGDEALLYKIFNFLAMFGSPGNNLYMKIGLLGAIIGLSLLVIRGTMNSKDLNFGGLLVGIALFLVFFGNSATVTVEDYYNGKTEVVDNVPLGSAIVGSVISKLGVGVIRTFGQGLSDTQVVTMPPQYALDQLYKSYAITDGDLCATNVNLCNFAKTYESFYTNCYLPRTRNPEAPVSPDLRKSQNALEDMVAFGSQAGFSGDNYLMPGSLGKAVASTCSDIGTALTSAAMSPAVVAALQAMVSGQYSSGSMGTAYGGVASDYTIADAFGAINGGLNAQLADSQQIMMNMVTLNVIAKGGIVDAVHNRDLANAALLESAAQKRNVQYAAQQSLFVRTLRAVMTVFEGIVYALAPFLAFLIPMGPIGFKIGTRYMQVLVWMFSWLPLMSVVNLFEIMSVQHKLNALAPSMNGAMLTSIVGIMQTQYTAGDYIALGGMMSTAVVGFAGLLVFGSVAAFSSLAGSVHGPEMINESIAAPDVANQAPMLQMAGHWNSAPGVSAVNSAMAQRTFNVGESWAESASLLHSAIEARQSQLAGMLSHGTTTNYNQALQNVLQQAAKHSVTGSNSEGKSAAVNDTWKIERSYSHGTDQASIRNAKTGVSGGVDAGVGAKGGGFSAGANVGASVSGEAVGTVSAKDSAQEGGSVGRSGGTSTTVGGSLSTEDGSSILSSTSKLESLGYSRSEAESISKTFTAMSSLQDQYQTAVQKSSHFGSSTVISEAQASAGIAGASNFDSLRNEALEIAGPMMEQYRAHASSLLGAASAQQREADAMLMAVDDVARNGASPEVRERAQNLVSRMLSTVDHGASAFGGMGDPGRGGPALKAAADHKYNPGYEGRAADLHPGGSPLFGPGTVRTEVAANVASAEEEAKARAAEGQHQAEEQSPNMRQAVDKAQRAYGEMTEEATASGNMGRAAQKGLD